MKQVIIASASRTAIGNFNGSLATMGAVDLAAAVIKSVLERASVDGAMIDEVILGNVLQAGLGQNPARQALLKSGLAESICGYTVNKVCGSGLKTVALAAQAIQADQARAIIAGGMENMSQAPYLLDRARQGYRLGHGELTDALLRDGLLCAAQGYHMGITAENIAKKYQISRLAQDEIALQSQQKAAAAIASGAFTAEITPITITSRKGQTVFQQDEFPRDTSAQALAALRPAFDKAGTVTAGNASGINDGAAALLVMQQDLAVSCGITPLARIRGYASAGVAPDLMGLGPIPATQKVLAQTGLTMADIDLVEANEAFAAQFIAVGESLNFDPQKVNIHGGAIALGHPIGASGARILVTLLHALQRQDKTLGLATLCIGGGQGIAMIVERLT